MGLDYQLSINNILQSNKIMDRLLSFSLQENSGKLLDYMELNFNNADNLIKPPSKQAKIELMVNDYKMGIYTATFINNNQNLLSIHGVSQDLEKGRLKHNRVFENKSLKEVLQTLATSLGLGLEVDANLSSKIIKYLLQNNQTDLSLLNELGELLYAVTSIKNSKLVFMDKNRLQTLIKIADTEIIGINTEDSKYKLYQGVKASYWDVKSSASKSLQLGGEPYLVIDNNYDEELLKELVKSKYQQIKEKEELELTVEGNPELQAGLTISIAQNSKYQDFIGSYKTTEVKHMFNGEAYTTNIKGYKIN